MRNVTDSMAVSLDGYVVGPDGSFYWTAPDEEVFNLATDEVRKVEVHVGLLRSSHPRPQDASHPTAPVNCGLSPGTDYTTTSGW